MNTLLLVFLLAQAPTQAPPESELQAQQIKMVARLQADALQDAAAAKAVADAATAARATTVLVPIEVPVPAEPDNIKSWYYAAGATLLTLLARAWAHYGEMFRSSGSTLKTIFRGIFGGRPVQ